MAQNNNQGIHQMTSKLLLGFCTTLLAILAWFLIDKINYFEKQIDKLDVKIENVTKGQIQIMTNLNIPIPEYFFKKVGTGIPNSNTPLPVNNKTLPNREAEIAFQKASKKQLHQPRSKYI